MSTKHITWQAVAWDAQEQFKIDTDDSGIRAEGMLSGRDENDTEFEIKYLIELSPEWAAQHILIQNTKDEGQFIDLVYENNQWFDRDGEHLPDFNGIDYIDITLTPFTNTLPVKRLQFEDKTPQAIEVMYIDLPSFKLSRMGQYYTKLGNHTYRYQDANLSTEIVFDDDDLVLVYPNLFIQKEQ